MAHIDCNWMKRVLKHPCFHRMAEKKRNLSLHGRRFSQTALELADMQRYRLDAAVARIGCDQGVTSGSQMHDGLR